MAGVNTNVGAMVVNNMSKQTMRWNKQWNVCLVV